MAEVFNGVVASVGVFPIKEEIRTQKVTAPGPHFGKQFQIDKTHTIAIKVIGLKVNGVDYDKWITVRHQKFNEGQELSLRLETGGEWKDVWEGSKILFFYEIKNGFVNIVDKGKMALMEQGTRPDKVYTFGTKQNESGGNNNTGYKKDYSGVSTGHAINCGLLLSKHKINNIGEILENSKNMHDLTTKLKAEYKQKNPNMSEYDVGAMVGHSILNACRIGGGIETHARKIMDELVPVVTAYVKGEDISPSEDTEPSPIPDDGTDVPF
jgi:hypothetical protein